MTVKDILHDIDLDHLVEIFEREQVCLYVHVHLYMYTFTCMLDTLDIFSFVRLLLTLWLR